MIQSEREVFCIMLSSNKLFGIRAQRQLFNGGMRIMYRTATEVYNDKKVYENIRENQFCWKVNRRRTKRNRIKQEKNIKRQQTSPFRSCAIEIVPLATALHQVVEAYKDVLGSEMGRKEMSGEVEQKVPKRLAQSEATVETNFFLHINVQDQVLSLLPLFKLPRLI